MPALMKTDYVGKITWLGVVRDRDADLASRVETELRVSFAGGPALESHSGGLTRPSCARVTSQYERGTEIRNTRQLAIVSAEELSEIASEMGGIGDLDPALVGGATMVIEGIPDFTHIPPPSSRLQTSTGATLTVDMENRPPCVLPGPPGIEMRHPGKGKLFKPAAKDRRGVTAWVEREGVLKVGGDEVRLHIPDQRAWMPEGGAP